MILLSNSDIFAWGLIVAAVVFAMSARRLSLGPALAVAALGAMLTKTILLDMV